MRKLTIDLCRNVALSRAGKCLSDEYVDTKTNMEWECNLGHTWYASFNNVKVGTWCPYCAGKYNVDIGVVESIVKSKSGTIIGGSVKNSRDRLRIKCENDHIWDIAYFNLKNGRWCPVCAGKSKLSINIAKQIAKQRGGKCLSTSYGDSSQILLWYCNTCESTWESNLSNIKHHNKWCPLCSTRKSEKSVYQILKPIFSDLLSHYRKFSWLKNLNNLELDFYVPSLKLAIEYDGKQHFEPIEYFGGKKRFKLDKKRDFLKNKLIHQNKQDIKHFIRIPYWEEISEENVRTILRRHGVLR